MPSSPHFPLVVGLGNPGPQYAGTRHNVGFLLLDHIATKAGLSWTHHRRWNADVARGAECLWLKPQTYMNLSGAAVAAVRGFYQIPTEQILVVYDDFHLPLGQLRIRAGGSAGGQNGMKNIIAALGTEAIPRVRFGIGAPQQPSVPAGDLAVVHVLGSFANEELEILQKSLALATEAIHCALRHGLPEAMNRYNGKGGTA